MRKRCENLQMRMHAESATEDVPARHADGWRVGRRVQSSLSSVFTHRSHLRDDLTATIISFRWFPAASRPGPVLLARTL